ncbi:MAG: hypothetical protein RL685_2524 [Pseudomonadota bacterium]|jgi:hypothetical protein
MNQLLWGALAMAAWVAGLFFLRFWRVSGERLFLFFVLAFWSLALNWLGLAVLEVASESQHQLYLLRLLAFGSIIVGVADKNRRTSASSRRAVD